jgi:hypothetical protein
MYILGMDLFTDLTEWYVLFHFVMCVVPNVACASEFDMYKHYSGLCILI